MYRRKYFGWTLVSFLSLSPIIIWYFAGLVSVSDFATISSSLRTLGKIAGLIGLSVFSLNIVLSARIKLFEDLFGGINKMYVAHHFFGGVAFISLLFHPLLIALSYFPLSPQKAVLFILPGSDLTINLGIFSLLLMMGLLVVTFFSFLPYQIWKFTHKFLGIAFFLGAVHALFVPSDISSNFILRYYMFVFIVAALVAYIYRSVFGRYFVKKQKYLVSKVSFLKNNIVEIKLDSQDEGIDYESGQFIFIYFKSKDVGEEIHPFSISQSPQKGKITITAKMIGDFTNSLKTLKPGTTAFIEGAYGRFTYTNYQSKNQVWIAGGIGITPFFSMAGTLKEKPEYRIHLYYFVKNKSEAVYLDELVEISKNSRNFKVTLHETAKRGRVTAESIKIMSRGLDDKEIFICGPEEMMKNLAVQFVKLEVKPGKIHTEEFRLL